MLRNFLFKITGLFFLCVEIFGVVTGWRTQGQYRDFDGTRLKETNQTDCLHLGELCLRGSNFATLAARACILR
jgi:hypothetical protein